MLAEKEVNTEDTKPSSGRYPWGDEDDVEILENVAKESYRKGHSDGFNVGALAMAVGSLVGASLLFVYDALTAKFKK